VRLSKLAHGQLEPRIAETAALERDQGIDRDWWMEPAPDGPPPPKPTKPRKPKGHPADEPPDPANASPPSTP
jgi:hypothetical protein